MAETWSSSRQALLVSTDSTDVGTERKAGTVAGITTYTESLSVACAYQWCADSRYSICVGIDPEHSDLEICLQSIFVSTNDIQMVLVTDPGVVQCVTSGADSNGPRILQYPKYYNAPSVPPDFDVVFQVWSEYDLDLNSLIITITDSAALTKTYGHNDADVIPLSEELTEFRLKPEDLLVLVGNSITVSVTLKDSLGRELVKDW